MRQQYRRRSVWCDKLRTMLRTKKFNKSVSKVRENPRKKRLFRVNFRGINDHVSVEDDTKTFNLLALFELISLRYFLKSVRKPDSNENGVESRTFSDPWS